MVSGAYGFYRPNASSYCLGRRLTMTREAIHSGGIRTELDRTFSKKNRLSQGLENVGAGSSGGVTFLAE